MTSTSSRVPPLRSAGVWTTALGVVHIACAPAIYPESIRSVLEAGVVGSVDADPTLTERRGVGFWYVTSGLAMIGLGAIVRTEENAHGRPSPATAPVLGAIGLWGILLTPVSGFWAFLPIAWLAHSSVRRARSQGR